VYVTCPPDSFEPLCDTVFVVLPSRYVVLLVEFSQLFWYWPVSVPAHALKPLLFPPWLVSPHVQSLVVLPLPEYVNPPCDTPLFRLDVTVV